MMTTRRALSQTPSSRNDRSHAGNLQLVITALCKIGEEIGRFHRTLNPNRSLRCPPTSVRKPGPTGAMQLGERALLTWLGTAMQIYMLLHSGHAQIVVFFTSTCTSSVQNLRTTNSDHRPRRVSISGPGGKRPSQADSRERGDQKKVPT